MSSRSEKESVVSAAELFLDRIRIAEEIGLVYPGGLILTSQGYQSYFVEVSVIADVERWIPEGESQRGWVLHPAMESMWVGGKKFLPILQAALGEKGDSIELGQLVAFEELEREDIVPRIGDIAIAKRLGSWEGERINIFILQEEDIQSLITTSGSIDNEKFIGFLDNI
jgi:hypothetical protein